MNPARRASLFAHLAIAFAGICLACAELDFILEIIPIAVVYLFFVTLSWRKAGEWTLSAWKANVLGVVIAVVATTWIVTRFSSDDVNDWIRDVPIFVALVPYLGPVVMALTLVRLYRPRSPGDFWVLQGLGLLQVALGAVLTNNTIYGGFLLVYLFLAVCAMAAYEGQRQKILSAPIATLDEEAHLPLHPQATRSGWLGFSLRWTIAVAACALPLFLITPRVENPEEWDPFMLFFTRNRTKIAQSGFSEMIDVARTGRLEIDDSIAFTVTVNNHQGRPFRELSREQRWRGIVLDRYDDGMWYSDLAWSPNRFTTRPPTGSPDADSDTLLIEYKVPGNLGGLFLAEPLPLHKNAGQMPVWDRTPQEVNSRRRALFFEADGTFSTNTNLNKKDYHYIQGLSRIAPVERYPALRVRDRYLQKLLGLRVTTLGPWTRELLLRLTNRPGRSWQSLYQGVHAHTLPGEALPPIHWESVARLLSHYLAESGDYSYTLIARREALSVDPVMDFLNNVKEGRCEHFASALALMLRSVGVPARVIKGYRGVDNALDGTYQVRQSHAHAWVEALVAANPEEEHPSGFDWLLLDPTPDVGRTESSPSALSRLWQLQQTGQALWQSLIVGYNAREQANLWENLLSWDRVAARLPWILGVGVVLLGAWLVLRYRRRWRTRSGSSGVTALYERLTHALARGLHIAPRSEETPRELATRAREAMGRRAPLMPFLDVPTSIVELFYRVRFGGEALVPEQFADATTRLEALEAALA